ncbi:MAG: hypothetical protein IKD88_04985 [Lachnospiraceae bacterium]|nr:hypothetical protein [Lachnospiraceae bacterium]
MHQFSPVSERMQLMHQKVRDRVMRYGSEHARIATEFVQAHESMVPYLRRPMILKALCENMTVRVEDWEMIVGNNAEYFCGCPIHPDWTAGDWVTQAVKNGVWTLEEDGLYHNPPSDGFPMAISPEDYAELLKVDDYWRGKTFSDIAASFIPDGYLELCQMECSASRVGAPFFTLPSGHLTPGYKKIVDGGYGPIRKQAQDWLDAHVNDLMGADAEKVLFYKAVTIVCDAATTLLKRFSAACLEKAAAEEDADRKAELESMADSLAWISENGARTYREALQAAITYCHLIRYSHITDVGSFGRIDQYTWPYLKADLEAGRITMEQAQEMTDCYFMKINSMYEAGQAEIAAIIGIGNTYLHNTIGGVDPQTGEDSSNPVTYMVLESVGRLSLHDPTISLRVNKNTPDDLWNLALETSKLVGGLPLFQNDEVIIPGIMKEMGFTLEDARDYAIIGCQEITGSGNDYSAANGVAPPYASIHYSVLLASALNDGKNPMNGHQSPIHTGFLYDMTSIEEVREAWRKLAEYYQKAQVSINNYLEYLVKIYMPHAILSISIDDCMEKGLDCTAGGAKYNSYGGTGTGLATVADSFTAIKYMCFDKKLCTTRELYDAVMANWEGKEHEALRQRIQNQVPFFGNNDPYADSEMKWVIDAYYDTCKECYSLRTKKFKAGLYGAADHVGQGYGTWATPNGRKAGTPIADAASPSQGADKNGPTAIFSSSLCYEHDKFMDGVCLNIRIHPTALAREDGISKLRDTVKAYMADGGAEAQFNIVSSETMRKAQGDPEEYKNLVVRIAGYSAYFVELTPDCQEDLISRTENMI